MMNMNLNPGDFQCSQALFPEEDADADAQSVFGNNPLEHAFGGLVMQNTGSQTLENEMVMVSSVAGNPIDPGNFGILLGESDMDLSPTLFDVLNSEGNGSLNFASMELFTGDGENVQVKSEEGVDEIKMTVVSPNQNNAKCGTSDNWFPNDESTNLEYYPGEYDFKVTPYLADDNSSSKKQKALYSSKFNKLYCDTGTAVPFKFEMNYDGMAIDHFMVRAFLIYEDNDAVDKPVLRCRTDMDKEKRVTDDSKAERVVHMMRYTDAKSDMKYYQNPQTKRCYILVPLKAPEPGLQYVTRSYSFSCRNSCSVMELDNKTRKAISIAFYLFDMESGQVRGRSFTHVRVCSAPYRDFKKECGEKTPEAQQNANRKRRSDVADEASALPAPKQLNMGGLEVGLGEGNMMAPLQMSYPVVASIRSVVRASVKSDDDGVSSSQESIMSTIEEPHRIQLKSLVKDIRWALKLKDSKFQGLRDYSMNVFTLLKLAQQTCAAAKSLEMELNGVQEEEKEEYAENEVQDNGQQQ